jgi:hypothetical protein
MATWSPGRFCYFPTRRRFTISANCSRCSGVIFLIALASCLRCLGVRRLSTSASLRFPWGCGLLPGRVEGVTHRGGGVGPAGPELLMANWVGRKRRGCRLSPGTEAEIPAIRPIVAKAILVAPEPRAMCLTYAAHYPGGLLFLSNQLDTKAHLLRSSRLSDCQVLDADRYSSINPIRIASFMKSRALVSVQEVTPITI